MFKCNCSSSCKVPLFRVQLVLSWCSVGVPRCTVVLPLFWGVVFFRHYSRVFRCSVSVLCFVVPCFSVPGFIVYMPWSFEQSFQGWKVANLKNIGVFSKAYILNSPLSPSCLGTTLALVTLQQGCIKNSKIIFLHI